MNVLVTGAYGFLGRNVCRLFADAGANVSGIGHGDWSFSEYSAYGLKSWVNADITLDALLKCSTAPDIIIHCAGGSSVHASVMHPIADFTATVSSTYAVLEYLKTSFPKAKLVYTSSAAVYGCANKLPISESDALHPVSPYGLHKLFSEQLCRNYAVNHNLDIAIVRLFSIYGPSLKKQLLWDACKRLKSGDSAFFGTGNETRDWLHVKDAVHLLALAAKHADNTCPIVNGGSGMATTNQALLKQLTLALDVPLEPRFNQLTRPGDPQHYQADIAIAQKWGWNAQINLSEGVKEYAKWFSEVTG
ncbi:NAD(P)-dependent oxidoreductase [Methylophilus sp. Leaf414]|uniref:NAD-dependent epimerase/dehydratase family protein n=1 Tax=Methylophilus sp. Leaf414 TaxID=1736371 RepID=UPI0006F44897|nr:NAD(P)-dependent oxidoreductase [Methylophilus sp. Leaf414]KQT34346.1 hypothetical protein ASG24_11515 [Methylophilus sp. Leaf414]